MPARPRRSAPHHRRHPDPTAKAIGGRIRKLRQERDFCFDAFVEETGLGRGYVSELERGLVVPTINALAKVAAALEVTVADLVLGDSPRERLFALLRHVGDAEIERVLAGLEAPAEAEAALSDADRAVTERRVRVGVRREPRKSRVRRL
jgi:transcriptional regulator with XRE-family HTH domain